LTDTTLFIVNVEVAVRRQDGRYLMIVRGAAEDHAAGVLAFPGGKVDAGIGADVLEATAIREVREEVGLEVSDPVYVESHTFEVGSTHVVDIVLLVHYRGGEPAIADPDEVAGVRWLSIDEMRANADTPEWVLPTLDRLERFHPPQGPQ
jgi:8-oxo-dGTP diphosphatase